MKQVYLTDLNEHLINEVKVVRTEPQDQGDPLIEFHTDKGVYHLTGPQDFRYGMYIDSVLLNAGLTMAPLTGVRILTLKDYPGYDQDERFRWTEYRLSNMFGNSTVVSYIWDDDGKAPLKDLKPILYKVS